MRYRQDLPRGLEGVLFALSVGSIASLTEISRAKAGPTQVTVRSISAKMRGKVLEIRGSSDAALHPHTSFLVP